MNTGPTTATNHPAAPETNMATTNGPHLPPDEAEWRIEAVPADEDGCRFYLEQYKFFRLEALQQDPDAFGSTYAREIAFTDEDWLKRVRNPLAQTFVVVRTHGDDKTILSATTLMGPLPLHRTKPASLVILENGGNSNTSQDSELKDDNAPLSYEVSGVYTRREARGQGFGIALMNAALQRAVSDAREQGRHLELKTIVYATNTGAVAFYEKCGFVATRSRQNVNPLKGPEPVTELDMCFRSTAAS